MKVLIAEDSASQRMLLRHLLEKWGYDVVETEDGGAAWQALEDPEIHLAVLDWMMPEMDGLELCRRIQELDRFVYAILLTGAGGKRDVGRALDQGASDYIVKPFDGAQLRARLRVGERIADMQHRLAHLQKMESVGRLSEGLAHEINTPAQYVGGNLRYLEEVFTELCALLGRVESTLDPRAGEAPAPAALSALAEAVSEADLGFLRQEIPDAIRQSREGIDRIAGIVSSMKQFANPGCGQREEVDLARTIERMVAVTRPEWAELADVETDFDPRVPPVAGYPGELNQMIFHLVANAAYAIKEVAGAEKGARGRITLATRKVGDWVELRVSDTGIGMTEATRAKIFDPFFTTKPVGTGIGQGLSVVHAAVVDKHGGSIDVDSEPGRGTTMTVRLPLGSASAAQAESSHAA